MPSAAGYEWPDDLDAIIRREAFAAHVPLAWAYAFIAVESAFDPLAANVSEIEDSHGLLQLNRRGGQGSGYSVEQLQDAAVNLRIGLPYVAIALAGINAAGISTYDLVYYVATRSGHPGAVPRGDSRIQRVYDAYTRFHDLYPAAYPPAPTTTAPPAAPAMQKDQLVKGLAALLFILTIDHPLTDLSDEDRTAVRYVATLI